MTKPLVLALVATVVFACEGGYLIWIPRAKSADPLYRFVKDGKAGYIDGKGYPPDLISKSDAGWERAVPGKLMNNRSIDDNDMPAEIDFSKGVRGLHHVPVGARVLMPVSIERGVWEYFAGKAEQRGMSELVTEVLKRDIQTNEASK
jgi:hypothetical protein